MTGSMSVTAGSFDRLRIEQQKSNALAAKLFVEETLGQPLASDDLHRELKDGVILCSLLNKIQAGTVVHINKKDQAFVKMANISSFLQGASKLGLQNSELFQTVDLWEAKDMMAVVHTILSLSRLSNRRTEKRSKQPKDMHSYSWQPSPTTASKDGRRNTTQDLETDEKHSRWTRRHKKEKSSTGCDYTSTDRKSQSRKEESVKNYLDVRNIFGHSTKTTEPEELTTQPLQSYKGTERATSNSTTLSSSPASASLSDLASDDNLGPIVRWHSRRRSQVDSAYGSLNFLTDEKTLNEDDTSSVVQGMQQTLLEIRDVLNERPPPPPRKRSSPPPLPPLRIMPSKSSPTSRTTVLEVESKISHRKSRESMAGKSPRDLAPSPKSYQEPKREKVVLYDDADNIISQYQLGNCIGKGQFGVVYRALDIDTGHLYAIKRIKIEQQDEEDQEIMQEVELLKSMDHPNVVRYIGCVRSEKYLDVILEFVESGSLLSTLKSFGTFSENLVAAYTVKILLGLSYLHAKDVVHCDLKAANILTTKTGNVKLTDFGVSLNLNLKQVDKGEPVGTPNWMAPEIIDLQGACVKSDIWSLGCTIVEMYTGKPPYSDLISMSALYRIVEDDMPPLPDDISNPMHDFLVCCFQKDPRSRPSAVELLRHEWLANAFAAEGDVSKLWATENELSVNTLTSYTTRNLSDNCLPTQSEMDKESSPHHALNRINTRRGSLPARKIDPVRIVHHSFLKTTFEKPITCKVCEENIKKHGMFCEACAIVCHDKCRSLAPHCVNATRFADKERHQIPLPSIPNRIPSYRQSWSPYPATAATSSPNVSLLSTPKRPLNLRRKSRPESDNCIIS
ncbi:kinase-like domain-containing protein [Umbelopsis sp. AD052]|nr:kinase-like domain-containing protein [Umbelopsis sp. AD052]